MKTLAEFIALNRFGLGPAPAEAANVAGDPRGWAAAQIIRQQTVPPALAAFPSSAHTLEKIHSARMQGPEKLRPATRELIPKAPGTDSLGLPFVAGF